MLSIGVIGIGIKEITILLIALTIMLVSVIFFESWFVGEMGIIWEIIGAGYIACAAYKTEAKLNIFKGLSYDKEEAVTKILFILKDQGREQLIGFLLLSYGLVFQLISGCASESILKAWLVNICRI